MSKFRTFKKNVLATLIALAVVPSAYAGVVRDDVDYQQFRDFAENKGKFAVGASNIEILDKNSNVVETMLVDGIVMPDWSAVFTGNLYQTNSQGGTKGTATLIHPQYIVSVAHNQKYGDVQFGTNDNKNPDNEKFNYKIVKYNNFSDADKTFEKQIGDEETTDYNHPRLHKLVTEVVPIDTVNNQATLTTQDELLEFKKRYPLLLRIGAGRQTLHQVNNEPKDTWNAYFGKKDDPSLLPTLPNSNYLTGGLSLPAVVSYWERHKLGFLATMGKLTGKDISKMTIIGLKGDSGSPIYAYDNIDKKWKFIGTYAISQAWSNGEISYYWTLNKHHFNEQKRELDIAGEILTNNKILTWIPNSQEGTSHILFDGSLLSVNLYNPKLKEEEIDIETSNRKDREQTVLSRQHHGKTFIINGENNTLLLTDNVNQGAGAIYFNGNTIVKGENENITWLGAGMSVAKDKTVQWQIKNPEHDRLSKIGEGTLLVNGTGENKGDISVGDGLVILNQQGGKAFNKVGIVSGRPTIKLETSNQVTADNIYFGYRGGRLDVNGNDLTFNYIKNVDEGAKIVNHHADKTATVTIKTDATDPNKSAFNGIFGENNQDFFGNPLKDKTYHNGKLNIIYAPENPQENKPFLLSGGTNLNGNLTVENGSLLLSGRPTPHAYDHLNNIEPFKDNDWISRDFTAKTIVVKDNAKLTIGRNVKNVKADFELNGNATAQLGFINGSTPVCVRSDYKGDTTCENKSYGDDVLKEIPTTNIVGNIVANDNSTMTIGNAHLTGKSTANGNTSTITLTPKSKWTMTSDSSLGNLVMENGSEITLNEKFKDGSNSHFNTLTIQGNLTGDGKFNYLTNIEENKGDKVVVKGIASGNHTLNVKDTGSEPNTQALVLLDLQNQAQTNNDLNITLNNQKDTDGYVDLGAWRYKLEQQNNQFVLVSNKKQQQTIDNTGTTTGGTTDTGSTTGGTTDIGSTTGGTTDTGSTTGGTTDTGTTTGGTTDTGSTTGGTTNTGGTTTGNNNTVAPPTQANNISRYTNAGLSELSAQANTLLHIGHGLTHQLLTAQGSGLWVIGRHYKNHHQSDLYRDYQKDENIMHIGAGHELELKKHDVLLGGAWSFSHANQEFSNNIHGSSDLNLFSLYSKITGKHGGFINADIGYGQGKTELSSAGETVDVKRNIATASVNVGKTFNTDLINIQPSVGVRYHRFSDVDYTLNGAKIHLDTAHLTSYRAGVLLEKAIPFANGLTFKPSWSSNYIYADGSNANINVNGYDFKQQFGRYTQHEIGLSIGQKAWDISLNASHADGNEIEKQQSIGFKLNYKW